MSGARSNAVRALFWSGIALSGAVAVLGLIKPLLLLGRYIQIDPNEGWNAYFTRAAMDGGVLYPPADNLISNNYPPLSFYIVGVAGRLIGDNIFAGRAIALLSMLFVAWGMYRWLRHGGSSRRIGLFAVAVFLGYAVTYGRDYVGLDDPQWLAHAVMMAGLLVAWRWPAGRMLVVAAFLMIAGGWIKHLLLPVPVALSLWLLWRSRPAFVTWVTGSVIIVAAAAGVTWWLYGPSVYHSLFFPREFLRNHVIAGTRGVIECLAPLFVLATVTVLRSLRDERALFVSVYLLIAGIIGVVACGGVGVDVNSFFDVLIAGSLSAALALEALCGRQRSGSAAGIVTASTASLVTGLYLAVYAAALVPGQQQDIRALRDQEAATHAGISLILAQGGATPACELPGLCYWAHRPFTIDFFYFGQKLKTGAVPPAECERVFGGGHFTMLQLAASRKHRAELLPPACNEFIMRNYRAVEDSILGTYLLPAMAP